MALLPIVRQILPDHALGEDLGRRMLRKFLLTRIDGYRLTHALEFVNRTCEGG